MSPEEAEAFAQLPYFNETVRVRLWDDRAKTPGAPTDDLGSYREMLTNHLEWQQRHVA
jgi:predicted HD phosphohydrolase